MYIMLPLMLLGILDIKDVNKINNHEYSSEYAKSRSDKDGFSSADISFSLCESEISGTLVLNMMLRAR